MNSLRFFVLLTVYLVMASLPSQAATLAWTNTAGGLWSAAANWSPNAVPAAGDSVLITNAGTYTVTNSAGANRSALHRGLMDSNFVGLGRLRLTAGTFTAGIMNVETNGALDLAGATFTAATHNHRGTWTWTSGAVPGAGSHSILAPGTLHLESAVTKSLSVGTIANSGTLNWNAGNLSVLSGAVFANNGTMNISNNVNFSSGGGAIPTFRNSATLNLASGADLTLTSVAFNNQSAAGISLTAASLTLNGASVSTNSGLLNLDGSSAGLFGATTFNGGGTVVAPANNSLRFAATTT